MCLLFQYEKFDHRDTRLRMQGAGLFREAPLKIVWKLAELLDRTQTVDIDGTDCPRGAAYPISQKGLGVAADLTRENTNRWMRRLRDAGVVRSEVLGPSFHNRLRYVFCSFDDAIARRRHDLEANGNSGITDDCILYRYECFPHKEVREQMEAAGLWVEPAIKLVWRLIEGLDPTETVEINGIEHPRGAVEPTLQANFGKDTGMVRETANRWLKRLCDAGIIRTEWAGKGHGKRLVYVFCAFDEAAERRRAQQPHSDASNHNKPSPSVTPVTDDSGSVTSDTIHCGDDSELCDFQPSYSLGFPNFSSHPSPPPSTGTSNLEGAKGVPENGVEGENLQNSHKTEQRAVPRASTRSSPGKTAEKTSQKEKTDHAVLLSSSLAFTDQWITEVVKEDMPDRCRQKWARQFLPAFRELYDDPRLADRFSEPAARAEACDQTMRRWLTIVNQSEFPPRFPGYLYHHDYGQIAFARAKREVLEIDDIKQRAANGQMGTKRGAQVAPSKPPASDDMQRHRRWQSKRESVINKELQDWYKTTPEERVEPMFACWCFAQGLDPQSEEALAKQQELIDALPITREDQRQYLHSKVVPWDPPPDFR